MDRREKVIFYIIIIICALHAINYGMMLIDLEFWNQGFTVANMQHDKAYYGSALRITDEMYAEKRRTTYGWILQYLMGLAFVGSIIFVVGKYGGNRSV